MQLEHICLKDWSIAIDLTILNLVKNNYIFVKKFCYYRGGEESYEKINWL